MPSKCTGRDFSWCSRCFLCGPLKGLKPKVNWIVRSWFPRETVRTVPAEAGQTNCLTPRGVRVTPNNHEFIQHNVPYRILAHASSSIESSLNHRRQCYFSLGDFSPNCRWMVWLACTPPVQPECWRPCQVGLKRADKGFELRTPLSLSHSAYKAKRARPVLPSCRGHVSYEVALVVLALFSLSYCEMYDRLDPRSAGRGRLFVSITQGSVVWERRKDWRFFLLSSSFLPLLPSPPLFWRSEGLSQE